MVEWAGSRGVAGADRAAEHREERWVPLVRATDVLLVGGGDALYLCHWIGSRGFRGFMASLPHKVYAG